MDVHNKCVLYTRNLARSQPERAILFSIQLVQVFLSLSAPFFFFVFLLLSHQGQTPPPTYTELQHEGKTLCCASNSDLNIVYFYI